MYRGKYFEIPDFLGGYCGNLQASSLRINQASDLDNIVLSQDGKGFRSRGATVSCNSSEFGGATGYPTIGLGALTISGADHILAIRNGKAYGATFNRTRNGVTFTDRTGAVTISTNSPTGDQTVYRWSFCQFNQTLIGFGGAAAAPDAPIKWAGETNNVAALGGSPPSALFTFSANNRVFAARTAAAPSTVYWSVLGNAEDWTSAGSGSAVAGTFDDNEPITGCAVLAYNKALIFKRSKIYQMDLTSAPFPITLLFDGIGCHSLGALKTIAGVVYFINIDKRMKATDGYSIMSFPDSAMDIMATDAIPSTTSFQFTPMHFFTQTISTSTAVASPAHWLIWCFCIAGRNKNMIWDLSNRTWLRCTTGFKFSSTCNVSEGHAVGGWNSLGKAFMVDRVDLFTDDTNDNSGHIDSYWQTGLINISTPDIITQTNRIIIRAKAISGGTATISYGYNGATSLSSSSSVSFTADNASYPNEVLRRNVLSGRGNGFQFKIAFSATDAGDIPEIRSVSLGGKEYGQKVRTAS